MGCVDVRACTLGCVGVVWWGSGCVWGWVGVGVEVVLMRNAYMRNGGFSE